MEAAHEVLEPESAPPKELPCRVIQSTEKDRMQGSGKGG